jgi:SDR family mycofactocin-dependent oxidoreductase
MADLSGRTALVTGGARGMGREHALALAGAGADLVLCDVPDPFPSVPYPLGTQADLDETVAAVTRLGRRCIAVAGDLRSAAVADRCVATALDEYGHLDIAVVNHGIFTGGGLTWELTDAQWDDILAVNVKSVGMIAGRAAKHMADRHTGSIILISSVAGLEGLQREAHYVAAKHGVIGIMRTLANEVGPSGVRVNVVSPTSTDTPCINNAYTYDLLAGHPGGTQEEAFASMRALSLLPAGPIEPQAVAAAVLWLASDSARHVTGVVLPVDCGACVKFGFW